MIPLPKMWTHNCKDCGLHHSSNSTVKFGGYAVNTNYNVPQLQAKNELHTSSLMAYRYKHIRKWSQLNVTS